MLFTITPLAYPIISGKLTENVSKKKGVNNDDAIGSESANLRSSGAEKIWLIRD